MGRRAARATHLALLTALLVVGVLLYLVFVLPRWGVLTGAIPATLATAGRIAAGVPLALAALPVLAILRQSLDRKTRTPEVAQRLWAWSAVLHILAGVLILLAALAEIWLGAGAAGPYLFAVYGAAASIAVLAVLALCLGFVAEKPPAEPKPAKAKAAKAAKTPKAAKAAKTPRGKKRGPQAGPTAAGPTETAAADAEAAETTPPGIERVQGPAEPAGAPVAAPAEPAVEPAPATEHALRNRRPTGKLKLRR